MVDNIDELNELVDGRVVLAVGATGVGKSTLMNAILQGSENMKYNDNMNIVSKKDLYYKENLVFKIGDEVKSCTSTPRFYKYNDIYFVDCPGTQD